MDIYSKHSIIKDGKARYYRVDLSKRSQDLEYSSPKSIKINDYLIETNKWGILVGEIGKYLEATYNKSHLDLYDFKVEWTKSDMFSSDDRINFSKISDSLYINCNQASNETEWFLSELFAFYGIPYENIEFIVHKAHFFENSEVQEYFINETSLNFKEFLMDKKGLSDTKSNKIIDLIKSLDDNLYNMSNSNKSFLLADSSKDLSGIKSRFLKYIEENKIYSPSNILKIKEALDLMTKYYSYYKF